MMPCILNFDGQDEAPRPDETRMPMNRRRNSDVSLQLAQLFPKIMDIVRSVQYFPSSTRCTGRQCNRLVLKLCSWWQGLAKSWLLGFLPRFRGRSGARLSNRLLAFGIRRQGRASCIRHATGVPSHQFTLLSECNLAPQLFEIRIIVKNETAGSPY